MKRTDDYVLVVDDDDAFRLLASLALGDVGVERGSIVEAEHGLEARRVIDELGWPRLITVDIRMPFADGFEFLDGIESVVPSQPPYVVMLTSSSLSEDRERAERCRLVRKYWEKPLRVDQLRELRREVPELSSVFGAADT